MDIKAIEKILADTAYSRVCGTESEKKSAEYIFGICENLGGMTEIEPFSVDMYNVQSEILKVGGKEYPCKAFFGSGSGKVAAPLLYLPNTDEVSLGSVKGKIVLVDSMGYWLYGDLIKQGAVGVVTYSGNLHFSDRDISLREIRHKPYSGEPILAVNIHAADAVEIANHTAPQAEIEIKQEKYSGESRNVVATIEGKRKENIVFSAHYDSVPLSQGAYDNMTGCIGLIYLLEHYLKSQPEYTLKFLFCGGEERGLLGSEAYCEALGGELQDCILNLNLDMLGSIMGKFTAFASCNKRAEEFFEDYSKRKSVGMEIKFGLRSSDSNVFADRGVPAVSFARYAGGNTALIHSRYDTAATVSPARLMGDMAIIGDIMDGLMDSEDFPVPREIDPKIREDLDKYFLRVR